MLVEWVFNRNITALFWDSIPLLFSAFLTFHLAKRTLRYVQSPLRHQGIPGPFLGKFTSWYRCYYVFVHRNWHVKLQALHEQYGHIVQIAPDEISVSDPRLRSTIYGFADERKEESFFPKAQVFETGQINEDFNFVFETDPKKARLGKYAMSHAYSEKGLSKLELEFDKAVEDFVEGLQAHHVDKDRVCSFSKWSLYYMYDLTARLTCGYSTCLCRSGQDLGDQISSMRVIFDVVGALVPINFTLSITTRWIRKTLLNRFLEKFYAGCLLNPEVASKESRIRKISESRPDHLLARFRKAEQKMRKLFPLGNWTEAITNNIFFIYAGATVASNALPVVFKLLYTHPRVLSKLRAELAAHGNRITASQLDRTEGKQCAIPYLEAVVLEALRSTPTFGLTLARQVPPMGCKLNDFYIPPGYSVGMSGWTVNYDKSYFGPDAAEFRPERWLGHHPTELAKDGSGNQRTMRNYLEAGWMAFGAGARVCVGRHMSMIAFTKVVGAMAARYDVDVVKAPRMWFSLIVHAEDMMVKIKERGVEEEKKYMVDDVPDVVVEVGC